MKNENSQPLEDFVRPEDSCTRRSTGYEKGHIRSMLKLDTYGPVSSVVAWKNRDLGIVPFSPNFDRFLVSESREMWAKTAQDLNGNELLISKRSINTANTNRIKTLKRLSSSNKTETKRTKGIKGNGCNPQKSN
jgi:hypothetical protein